jgi:peptide/nickel transport system ATP-binding protein
MRERSTGYSRSGGSTEGRQSRHPLDAPVRVPSPGSPAPNPESGVLLEVRQLEVGFPAEREIVHPVRGVSLRVWRGQRVGIIGESGSGKSLTALAIMRLIRPPGRVTKGEVFLNGRDVLRLGEQDIARVRGAEMAMIYQNPMAALNPLRRVGDQVIEAIRVHEDVAARVARAQTIDLFGDVGIADPARQVDRYPHEFSGGMRQRVMIAMAMSLSPDLLIADEPTTALDVTTQARVLEVLERVVEERNTALILITHDLAVAASVCTDVRVMYAGRIVEAAPADSLYSNPVHPYSEALLQSIVDTHADVNSPVRAIPGHPPLPDRLPPGCTFHPRCPYAEDVCRDNDPPPVFLGHPEQIVAECHFAVERFGVRLTEPSGS